MADDETEAGDLMDSNYAKGLLHTTEARLAELREKAATIRDSYAGSTPIDDSELQAVLAEIDDLAKVKRGLERKLEGEIGNDD